MAYAMGQADEYDEGNDDEDESNDDEGDDGAGRVEADSDVDNLDFQNFKGIYFGEDPNRKY